MPKIELIEMLPADASIIKNDADFDELVNLISSDLPIILDFPAFTDGRAFSQARQIRRHGFKGDLIASGDLRSDQARQYAQVGFNKLHFTGEYNKTVIETALSRFSTPYQSSSHADEVVYQKRLDKEKLTHLSGGGAFNK